MAGTHLSGPEQQPTGRDAVADYLAEVSHQLPGPIADRPGSPTSSEMGA